MTGQAPLGVDLQPPGSLSLPAPVWGIDPSTKRISVACVQDGFEWVETLSLPQPPGHRRLMRYAMAASELNTWVQRLERRGRPSHVFVEEPFMPTERRQKPTSYVLLGALWVGLAYGLGANAPGHEVRFQEIGPGTWKRTAIGEGRGAAKPHEYMAWARDVAGYGGSIEDEAAAIGVATAGGVIVSGG